MLRVSSNGVGLSSALIRRFHESSLSFAKKNVAAKRSASKPSPQRRTPATLKAVTVKKPALQTQLQQSVAAVEMLREQLADAQISHAQELRRVTVDAQSTVERINQATIKATTDLASAQDQIRALRSQPDAKIVANLQQRCTDLEKSLQLAKAEQSQVKVAAAKEPALSDRELRLASQLAYATAKLREQASRHTPFVGASKHHGTMGMELTLSTVGFQESAVEAAVNARTQQLTNQLQQAQQRMEAAVRLQQQAELQFVAARDALMPVRQDRNALRNEVEKLKVELEQAQRIAASSESRALSHLGLTAVVALLCGWKFVF